MSRARCARGCILAPFSLLLMPTILILTGGPDLSRVGRAEKVAICGLFLSDHERAEAPTLVADALLAADALDRVRDAVRGDRDSGADPLQVARLNRSDTASCDC